MTGSAASTPAAVSVPAGAVALSTASVYPEPTAVGFEMAAELGYDAVELMVALDDTSQDVDTVLALRDEHQLPVVAVHAPCLLITQRVWGTDPWGKLERSAEMAHAVGADVVVVHPAFRWQRDYGRGFLAGLVELEQRTGLAYAVENMYPWRARTREMQVYVPGWDPVRHDAPHVTLDLSHTAVAGADPVAAVHDLGERLTHLHLADGSGSPRDEHLVPGRGGQPCADLLELLAGRGFAGHVVVEINTRRAPDRGTREADLAESLAFARLHLASPRPAGPPSARAR